MSDEDAGRRVTINSRQLWVLFLVSVLAVGTVIGTTAFLTNEVTVSNRLTLASSGSGVEVTVTGSYDIELSDDWATSDTVILNTSEGNMSVSSSGASSATLAAADINGTFTDVTTVSASGANITFDPDDKNATTVGDGITAINFTDVKVDDSELDLIYSASSQGLIIVNTNAEQGTQYGLIDDDTNEGLDVAVADANGQIVFDEVSSTTSQNARIEELGSLFIREESPDHSIINDSNATVIFYELEDDNPTIVSRSAANGEIDLTGLPVDESFIASVEAAGYHNRTVVIDDLSQQQTVFLLNKTNITSVEVTFVVDDQTGDFGDDATFVIQKAINRSLYNGSPDGFSWTNIGGDEVGASNQYTIDLVHEDRYRMRISNDDQTRILGAHVAEADQIVTVTVQDVTIEMENVSTDVAIGFEKDEENNQIDFVYNDSESDTTDLEVIIYERGNRSNEKHNQTHAGPFGELVIEEPLNSREMNASWVVEFEGTRGDGTIDGQYIAGGRGDVDITAVPDWVREFASVFAILLVPTVLGGQRAETAAVVSTAIAAVLWYIRWLPSEVSIMAILLAATIAIGFKLRERGQGNIA